MSWWVMVYLLQPTYLIESGTSHSEELLISRPPFHFLSLSYLAQIQQLSCGLHDWCVWG